MSRLVAFGYRDGSGRAIEYLDQHLYEVSIHIYPLIATKRLSTRFIGVLAGLLHDIGKAVDVYQKCLIHDPRTRACRYTGHEVFSTLLAVSIVETRSLPQDVVKDMASSLRCSEDVARRAIMRVLAISILYHHQAMGCPRDRLESFLKALCRASKSCRVPRFRIDRGVVDTVARALGNVRRALREDSLCVEIDPRGIDRVEALLDSIAEGSRVEAAESILTELRKATTLPPSGYSEKLLLLSKFVTGCLIAADTYVAGRYRGESRDRPLHRYLEKAYRFYGWLYTEHRDDYVPRSPYTRTL